MDDKANIFWCTGMSGTGKSTLAEHAKTEIKKKGLTVLILDGDIIREKYDVQLGFGREDVEKNNMNVVKLCEEERWNYDVIIVPIISPIEKVRLNVKKSLSPLYHLLYIRADIEALKERDPKGLYRRADKGELNNLIGYSDINPYDQPENFDLIVDTSNALEIEKSKDIFTRYIIEKTLNGSTL
jgi:adenylylsulfate kinase